MEFNEERQKEDQDIAEAQWLLQRLLKPTFVWRMARGMYDPLRPASGPQKKSARTRLVNASREVLKVRDEWIARKT